MVWPLDVEVFAEPGEVLCRARRSGPIGRLRRGGLVLEDLFGACVDPPDGPKLIEVSQWDVGRVRVRVRVAADAAGDTLAEWLRSCERRSVPDLPSTAVIDDASSDLFGPG